MFWKAQKSRNGYFTQSTITRDERRKAFSHKEPLKFLNMFSIYPAPFSPNFTSTHLVCRIIAIVLNVF